jgi:hypothetical protein
MNMSLDEREIKVLKLFSVFSSIIIIAFVGAIVLIRLLWGDASTVAEAWTGATSSLLFGFTYGIIRSFNK